MTIAVPGAERFPAAAYTEAVLAPAWDHGVETLLEPMLAAHRAWAVMLAECELLPAATVRAILHAVAALDVRALRGRAYDGRHEDLFFAVEALLLEHAGEQAGGLHLARSRNDLGVALYRMALRERLLTVVDAVVALHGVLVDLAGRHTDSVMLAHTHTQPAQPTTLGHWLLAAADGLARDLGRLRAAYATVNRSPLGAAALGGTGFPVDRERVAALLGFDGLVENSYDAIGGADYLTEAATAMQLLAVHTGRVTVELLNWATSEFGRVRVGDGFVQVSSIMPQKRNPVSLEHTRSLLSRCAGDAQTVVTMVHNTPFGDINDTEDDLQPVLWRTADDAASTLRLLAGALASATFDTAAMRVRAAAGFSSVTEVADHLVRDHGLPFRTAHHIVSGATRTAVAGGASQLDVGALEGAAREVLGHPLGITPETLATVLDPDHFVAVRTTPGGVAPEEVRRMHADRVARHADLAAWPVQRRRLLAAAADDLDAAATDLAGAT